MCAYRAGMGERIRDIESPATLAVREPSLDDVFLALTGRRVEPEDPSEEATRGAA